MTRLSNDTREQMARALTRHKLTARADALSAESVALFHAVLDDAYDESTRKLMKALLKRHEGAFAIVTEVSVNVRGMEIEVGARQFGWRGIYFTPEVEKRPVLSGHTGWRNPITSYLDGNLADRIVALAQAREKFSADAEEAYRKALGTIGQFTTAKKLADEWPEAMPVIGHLLPEYNRTLPVVQLTAINDEFGLPPADEKLAA